MHDDTHDELPPFVAAYQATAMLRDAARRHFHQCWPANQAAHACEDPGLMSAAWLDAAAQGWTSFGLEEDEPGMPSILVLMEETGRAGCPLPLSDAVLAHAVLAGNPDPEADALRQAIADGRASPAWAFGPCGEQELLTLAVTPGRSPRVSGTVAHVENTAIATHLLVQSGAAAEIVIVSMAAPGVHVTPTPGLARPALARVALQRTEGLRLSTTFDLGRLPGLARLMLSARALGAARRGLELLTEYALTRTQFGKKIGQYQAIQHKLADCLTGIETVRLAVARAGSATPAELGYAASVASALAGQTLRQVCLQLHHGFGGVSFWEEHEMPRHFRRIHGDLVRLGGVHAARRDVAAALLDAAVIGAGPALRLPDLDLGPAANRFRQELQAWLRIHWEGSLSPDTKGQPVNHRRADRAFSGKLADQGWLSLTWPATSGDRRARRSNTSSSRRSLPTRKRR